MTTLAIAGCSISDRTKTTHCYGDYLAKQLGMDYLHLASGSGSNFRSQRRIVESVQAGDLVAGDIVLMQLTDPTRRELHSHYLSYGTGLKIAKQHLLTVALARENAEVALGGEGTDPNLDVANHDVIEDFGVLSKFKQESHTWQMSEHDAELHKTVQQYGMTWDLAAYENRILIDLLRGYLQAHGITFKVIWEHLGQSILNYWLENHSVDIMHESDIDFRALWPESFTDAYHTDPYYEKYHLEPGVDLIHFSIMGHKKIANILAEHLKTILDI